jgi:DNA-binding transcriptional ArsR family regulator
MSDSKTSDAGRYAYEGLDRVLHEKARLGILTALAAKPNGLVFAELSQLCSLTDGNLSRHLDVLAEAGLIKIHKEFAGKRPKTTCRLTPLGRRRFREYLAHLEQVLRDAAVQVSTTEASSLGLADA